MSASEFERCPLCDVYADAHERCGVTVECPHCLAPAGQRCVRPDGSETPIGSHAARVREAERAARAEARAVYQPTGTGWPT